MRRAIIVTAAALCWACEAGAAGPDEETQAADDAASYEAGRPFGRCPAARLMSAVESGTEPGPRAAGRGLEYPLIAF